MPRWIIIALLCAVSLPAQEANYINVYLSVSAPKAWVDSITDSLKTKLNAIPDVQVVDKNDNAMFTVYVDVNSVSNKSDELIGYSLMSLIYGTYDRAVLKIWVDEAVKVSEDPSTKAYLDLMAYAVSGNIFLAGTVHTHGSTDSIDSAYDQIVAKLKSDALPEFRRFRQMVLKAAAIEKSQSQKAKPTVQPLPRTKNSL